MLVDETAEGDGLNSMRLREADLVKHLNNKDDKELPSAVPQPLHDELEEEQRLLALSKTRKPVEFGSKDDFQLAQALNHFKGLPVKLSKTEKARDLDVEASAKPAKQDAPVKQDAPAQPQKK